MCCRYPSARQTPSHSDYKKEFFKPITIEEIVIFMINMTVKRIESEV